MSRAELTTLIAAAKDRVYKLKTKKAKEKAWNRVRDLERELFHLACKERDVYRTHSVKGTVRRFRSNDDVGLLVDTPYGALWCSQTSDVLSKSWYSHTCCVEYTEGQEVIIEIEVDVNMDSLKLELIPRRIHGGRVNEEEYAELCKRTNLAFFKYPDGHMSGLFA
jgi:hypothetical protein